MTKLTLASKLLFQPSENVNEWNIGYGLALL